MARTNTNQLAAAGTILAAPYTLSLVTGFNVSGVLRYFQLFDVAVPAPGAVPVQSIQVPGLSNFSYRPTELLAPFGTACVWRVSSTPGTLTAAAEIFWVHSEGQSQ